ncbi:peptide deformylase [Acetobacterium carbinolicum]|jgi:peptide deformylase|uniref:peptide deformylase n=1 Tax=Acetobacterium TaxID=33951 RepID=UPI000DBEC5F9|nr:MULTISPECIES: peptide deformylase [unclassified Acetobacterium]AWW25364.1 peptide deformylase [Acetobacterium sp. KB-1]MDK2941481.1 peptide deformylase [Acetobacterium sp.]MDZ5723874.1 peptide deformylase [Acetobacterium sp. K1/6]
MAIRQIRIDEDPILRKKSRVIEAIDEKIKILNDDMVETMGEADGVGLAAPQVGILKRLFVIDVGDGPMTFINPTIISTEGEEEDEEACLSLPGQSGIVKRPQSLVVEATDLEGTVFQLFCSDLLARAVCHELDHLDGILFIDRVEK